MRRALLVVAMLALFSCSAWGQRSYVTGSTTTCDVASATSYTCTLSVAPTIGNCLIVGVGFAPGTITISDNQGSHNTFTLIHGDNQIRQYRSKITSTGAGFAVTFSGASGANKIMTSEYAGTACAPDAASYGSNSGNDVKCGNTVPLATTVATDLVVCSVAHNSSAQNGLWHDDGCGNAAGTFAVRGAISVPGFNFDNVSTYPVCANGTPAFLTTSGLSAGGCSCIALQIASPNASRRRGVGVGVGGQE